MSRQKHIRGKTDLGFVTVFQVWDNRDIGTSEEFVPTRKEARALQKEFGDSASDIYEFKIDLDVESICRALTKYPTR